MLARIRAWRIWTRMRREYLAGDYGAALALAQQLRANGVRTTVSDAFEATLDILSGNSKDALRKFRLIASQTDGSPRPDTRYVHEYCAFQIGMIENDRDEAETHRRSAKSLGASRFVTRALPIMDQPLPGDWF